MKTPATQNDDVVASMRAEAMRLIGLQKELLSEIKDKIPTLTPLAGSGDANIPHRSSRKFTPEAIDRKIAELEENRLKVDKLDMVLAVVGTMKAGKSTCINAIVGREILPNRNRPMTALPTIIRHVAGAIQPTLHFSEKQQQPIQSLLRSLQARLKKLDIDTVPAIASDRDLRSLADQIRAKFQLHTRYAGEEGIFSFLKKLNDLVRLSKELGVAFPFESYTSITDFPAIEVEFFHLRQTGAAQELGRFALLDTPGFNEAGQSQHLMPMLQEQLSKATAVLAVLDYTQLKSESEAQLRHELRRIAAYAGDRMFALVNKFDAKNANSDDAPATRNYVAHNLLNDVFGKAVNAGHRIFPVSGQLAYLVKRAELELERKPDLGWVAGQEESWIDAFGKEAFGLRYQRSINDRNEVLEACADLWRESLFNEPLDHAIRYSHRNAAQMAIQAATSKLYEIALGSNDAEVADGIGTMLSMRRQGLEASAEQLQDLVDSLRTELKELQKKERRATRRLDDLIDRSKSLIAGYLDIAAKDIQRAVAEALKGENTDNSGPDSGSPSVVQRLLGISNPDRASASPTNKTKSRSKGGDLNLKIQDTMAFDSAIAAKIKLNDIANKIQGYLDKAAASVSDQQEAASEEFRAQLEELQKEVSTEISAFKGHAKKAGFESIKLVAPRIRSVVVHVEAAEDISTLIKDKSHTRQGSREQSGGWGWVKRKVDFFNAGWGKDDYERHVSKFEISKDDLLSHYKKFVAAYVKELKASVLAHFSEPLETSKASFFEQLGSAFETIRENMENSLRDQSSGKEEQAAIKAALLELQARYDDSVEDTKALARHAKKLTVAARDA